MAEGHTVGYPSASLSFPFPKYCDQMKSGKNVPYIVYCKAKGLKRRTTLNLKVVKIELTVSVYLYRIPARIRLDNYNNTVTVQRTAARCV